MQAFTHIGYVSSSELRLTEVPTPVPGSGRVLVQVEAASVNPVDWHLYRGDPWVMRLRHPIDNTSVRGVGEDFAGVVVDVGDDVTAVSVGQRVFGTIPAAAQLNGSIAEYVDVETDWLAPLPSDVAPTEAAAVGLAGLTALQALRDVGKLEPGDRVLVWGAAGGVGHLAVQIARNLGAARVDAVCSARNIDLVESLGADKVFDYTRHETPAGPYDVVVDTVATASAATLRRLVAPNGIVVTIGAVGGGRLLGPGRPMIRRALSSALRRITAKTVLTKADPDGLTLLGGWMREGTLRVVLEQVFAFRNAPMAYETLEKGRVRGKLAIQIPAVVQAHPYSTEAGHE